MAAQPTAPPAAPAPEPGAPPPSLWRTPALLLVAGVVFATAVVSFMRVPLLPAISHDLGLTTRDLATVTTVFAFGRLLMDLPAGRIVDRFPPATGLAGSGAGLALGALLVTTASSLPQILVGVALVGVASSITNTSGMTVFATSAPPDRRGAAMAGFQTALLTGQTAGPALGGVLAGLGGWRLAQGTGAGIGALIVVAALVAPLSRRRPGARAERRGGDGPHPGLTTAQAAVLSAVPFAVFFSFGAMTQTLLPIIGDAELGLSVALIGLLIGLGGMARFAGAILTGRLSDRVSRKAALVPSLLLMGAGAALLTARPTVATWLAAIVLLALGSSGVSVAATVIADRVAPETLGRRLATYRFTGDVGLLAGPAIAGSLYAGAGRPAAMLVTAALLAACGAAVAVLISEREVA